MVATERRLPGLDRLLRVQQVNLFTGLMGVEPKYLFLPEGQNGKPDSLSSCVEEVNSSGEISPFTLEYFSEKARGWISREWGNFYLDAPRGFFLVWKTPVKDGQGHPFTVAGISFSIKGFDSIEQSRYPRLNLDCLKKGDVLVAQIQGQKGLSRKGLDELNKLKWERALLQTVVDWAQRAGLPRVLVAPSANNHWLNHAYCQQTKDELEDLKERLFLRYDVTARRCGFRQEAENLPYSLELPGEILYETLWS